MIAVIESIMVYIMAESRNQNWKCVKLVKFCMLDQILVIEYKAAVLRNIRPMEVIMVVDLSPILVEDLNHELDEFMVVYRF